ncbi:T9SS type A sorting domain-containing protein [Pontibacter russatus]|uniref:T9SS type A sorting domain-containing protein n=1 Tax=Pontibacter russatus TaxID=2694929 RepID=UPI001F1B9511|nr:T9SS type A sorting domain-containing protein [Pontibacter russatus]
MPGVTEAQQQVSSLTLYDANTKQAIQTLTGGATLNLATLPSRKLNIRANTSPSKVGSVVFALSGAQSRNATESIAPYDLMGDDGAWTPSVGSYSLKATPYTSSGGGGTAGTALTVAFTVVDQEPDTNNPLISNIKATSGRSYVLADLAVGVRAYTDRTYEVTSAPASLAGAALVRTANDDKHSSASALLSFELSEGATVYVAYDPRATALPSWLSGWQQLTDRIGINDSKISYMNIYSKSFPAGAVSLGGNKQSPAAGAENNYFVVAKAAQAVLSSEASSSGGNTLSKADNRGLGLKVYPNPSSGGQVYAEISNFGGREALTVTLHDVLGRAVASVDAVTDQQGYLWVEVPGHTQLKQGMYIIRASAAGGKAQARLLVR